MHVLRRTLRIASVVMIAILATACADLKSRPKQSLGTLFGAGLGALAGSQIGGGNGRLAAVAIGTLAGAYLGGEVGKSLDRADRLHVERTSQSGLEFNRAGQTSSWRNPDSGHSGTFTPTRTYRMASGQDCRDFESTVNVDGREERVVGRGCRRPDGTWSIAQ